MPSGRRRFVAPRRRPWSAACGVLALALVAVLPLGAQTTRPDALAVVVPIRGEINRVMRDSLTRRLDEARAAGAHTVIFEMDTPGGRLDAAFDIFSLIERFDGHTVAWVNDQAYSAGALISAACDEIWMTPASSIGDCAPILLSPMGPAELDETNRAKVESPILQKFRDAAARKGYNQLLSRAMVTLGTEVWWLERTSDPTERRFVDAAEKTRVFDEVPEDERAWRLVASFVDPVSGNDYPVDQPIVGKDMLLTMSQSEAVAFGFARGIARSADELAGALGLTAQLVRMDKTAWEKFADFLNHNAVRGILLILVLVGAYIEYHSPGLIIPGAIAALALLIFLAAPYAAGLRTVWPLVLLAIGLVLLAIEFFVLPGFGIAGILGIAFVLLAIVGSFVPINPDLPPLAFPSLESLSHAVVTGIKTLTVSVVVSVIGILLLIRYLPESKLAGGVITNNPDATVLTADDPFPTVAQIGDVGVVTGDLRPGGQARFGHEIVDVSSQGEYVDVGRRVQVIRRDGSHIVVRPLPDDGPAAGPVT